MKSTKYLKVLNKNNRCFPPLNGLQIQSGVTPETKRTTMSKTTLKKHLQSLTKEQIIGQVLGLYDTCKPAKEYLEYLLNPNEKEKFKSTGR
jgi:hypothetical protein